LGLGHIDVDHTIDAIKRELQEDQRAFKPYLFVDTEFRRQGQSIAILALCKWMRRLDFPQQFWRKTLVDQVEAARQRVREHMKSTLGELRCLSKKMSVFFRLHALNFAVRECSVFRG